jgi:hypothetical protein
MRESGYGLVLEPAAAALRDKLSFSYLSPLPPLYIYIHLQARTMSRSLSPNCQTSATAYAQTLNLQGSYTTTAETGGTVTEGGVGGAVADAISSPDFAAAPAGTFCSG